METFTLVDEHQNETNNDDEPQSKRVKLLQQSSATSNENDFEEIKKRLKANPYFLLSAPWIRVGAINKIINRRCLDKWLATVLIYLSQNPAISMHELCNKFNVLTQVQIKDLCEILNAIGCLKMMAHPVAEVNLFSDFDDQSTGKLIKLKN
jgi:hypothetical protein